MATAQPDKAGGQNDHGKRDGKEEDRDEACRRNGDHDVVLERPLADAHDGLEHDCEYGRLQAEEQRLHYADIAECGVNPTHHHDADKSRQHK